MISFSASPVTYKWKAKIPTHIDNCIHTYQVLSSVGAGMLQPQGDARGPRKGERQTSSRKPDGNRPAMKHRRDNDTSVPFRDKRSGPARTAGRLKPYGAGKPPAA